MFWWFPVGGKGRTLADLQLFRLTEHRSIGPDLESHEPPWFCIPILRVVDTQSVMESRTQGGSSTTIAMGVKSGKSEVEALLFRGRVRHSRWQ